MEDDGNDSVWKMMAMMMVMMMAMMMMMKMAMMMLKNEPVTILNFSCSLTCGPYHSLKWYKVCFNDF